MPTKKERFLSFWNKGGYLILCMAIPALVMYCIYLAREIHPFGDGSVLVLDLNGQYVWFFEALRNAVYGDGSLLYSFERALGGEFAGIYAYYLASPFSYLVCLFPRERIQEALLTLFLLKTAICGGTFGFYLHKTSKKPNKIAILIFSLLYALCSYGIIQQHNTMWIDAMMWLPMITLGIEQLIKYGRFKFYTFFFALTVFSNFYIGYMVCFWCLLYFLFYLIAEGKEANPLGERLHVLKSILRFLFYSLLSVGIAAVILLGAYYSLNFGKTTFSNTKWEWYTNLDLLELVFKFLPGSYDTVRPEGYPFLYCGVLTLLLLPGYFLSKKFTMRQKISSGVLVLLFAVSFSLSVIDLFWHGFQQPNWLNYRYSFMLCFFLCVLACRALQELNADSVKAALGIGGLMALFCIFLQKYSDDAYVKPKTFTCIWFTLGAVFLNLCALAVYYSANRKRIAAIGMAFVVCAEVFLNGLWSMNAFDDDVVYTHYSYYNNFLSKTRPLVESVQSKDTGFYRMEKTYFRKVNDNMGLGMRGLSGSTSTLDQETIRFLDKMGYASVSHWSQYEGGTPVSDSLLGIRYLLSDDDLYADYYEIFERDPVNGYVAYRNPYALSIAYGVSEDLMNFPLGYLGNDTEDAKNQSSGKIGDAVSSLKSFLNRLLDIEETVRRDEYTDLYDSPFERLNAILTAMLGETETVRAFVAIPVEKTETSNLISPYYADGHTCYGKSKADYEASLTYTLQMPVDGELYFYQPTNYPRETELILSNLTADTSVGAGTFGGTGSTRIISLGKQLSGDDLKLTMKLMSKNLYFITGEECFYYLDWDVFQSAIQRLATDQFRISDYTEHSFRGTITTSDDNEWVLTTIAFDQGWKITVDGKPVEMQKALGALVAFRIGGAAGEHTIEMTYRPNTLILGGIISCSALALFLLLIALEKKMKTVPFLRAIVSVTPRQKKEPKPPDSQNSSENPGYKIVILTHDEEE